MSYLEEGDIDYVWEEKTKPNFDGFVGFIFEDICIQKLKSLNKDNKLPFKAKNIGQWWDGREEIDVVALDGKGSFTFCECKWTVKKIGISMLEELQNKANKFPGAAREYFGFFSKSGFSKGIKDLSEKRKDIVLFDY